MTAEQQAKKELLDLADKEIQKSKLMIAFYKHRIENLKDKEEITKNETKISQLQHTLDFNTEFYDFFSSK